MLFLHSLCGVQQEHDGGLHLKRQIQALRLENIEVMATPQIHLFFTYTPVYFLLF